MGLFHGKESILIRKDYRKDEYVMEKTAVPTGDVVKDWDIREDEKIYFYCVQRRTSLQ